MLSKHCPTELQAGYTRPVTISNGKGKTTWGPGSRPASRWLRVSYRGALFQVHPRDQTLSRSRHPLLSSQRQIWSTDEYTEPTQSTGTRASVHARHRAISRREPTDTFPLPCAQQPWVLSNSSETSDPEWNLFLKAKVTLGSLGVSRYVELWNSEKSPAETRGLWFTKPGGKVSDLSENPGSPCPS